MGGYYCWFDQVMKYKKQNLLKMNGVTAMNTQWNVSEFCVLPQKKELEEQRPQKDTLTTLTEYSAMSSR